MASATEIQVEEKRRLHPVLRVILQGVLDKRSPFSYLRGIPDVLELIWWHLRCCWKENIQITVSSDCLNSRMLEGGTFDLSYNVFPKPMDLNINMMPFIMEETFEDTKLPEYLEEYWENMIRRCIQKVPSKIGKIGYLTIHESFVEAGTSQGRSGIHVESPNIRFRPSSEVWERYARWDSGNWLVGPYWFDAGGIFMGSNVRNSCKIWNCKVLRPEVGPDIVCELGGIEHLREFLPEGEVMKSNNIYWLTDRTPIESLPLKAGTYRQFFRLVASHVFLWYEDHSTKNPFGVVPDPSITKIVKGSKFGGDIVVIEERYPYGVRVVDDIDDIDDRACGTCCRALDRCRNKPRLAYDYRRRPILLRDLSSTGFPAVLEVLEKHEF